jgi:hypothetical protein
MNVLCNVQDGDRFMSNYRNHSAVNNRNYTASEIIAILDQNKDYARGIEEKNQRKNFIIVSFGSIGFVIGLYLLLGLSNALFPVFRVIISSLIIFASITKSISSVIETTFPQNLMSLTMGLASVKAEILIKKREELLIQDDYGNWKTDRWVKEIDYFIKKTIYPKAKERNYNLHEDNVAYWSRLYMSVELVTVLHILKGRMNNQEL